MPSCFATGGAKRCANQIPGGIFIVYTKRGNTAMRTKIRKWGNSLGLRIPKSFAEEVSVEDGSTVDISVADGQLVVRAIRPRRFELRDLLAEVSDENLHAEVTTGTPRGRESW